MAAATPAEVQKQLDAMVTSGSPVNGSKSFAGDVEITAGELKWKTGVKFSTGQRIWSRHAPRTRIIFYGRHEDPPCFLIHSYTGPDNGYVDMPELANLQIDCPNGGRAVGVDPSVKILENFEMHKITTTGMVDLMCEQYGTLLSTVRIYTNPESKAGYQLLRMGGGKSTRGGACNTLFHCKLQGYTNIPDAKAACEFHGATSIEGNTRFEDIHHDHTPADARPMLYFGDWIDNEGASHRGNHATGPLFHDEAHRERLWAVVEKSDFTATSIGGTELWPWHVQGGGVIRVQMPVHNAQTVVTPDGTGRLYVGGKVMVGKEPVQ